VPEGFALVKANVLSPEQMSMVIRELSNPWRTMVMFSVTTAIRESELFALKDEDFDLECGKLTIQRRLYRGKLGPVKTKKSKRRLPLCPEVVKAVRNLNHKGRFKARGSRAIGKAYLPQLFPTCNHCCNWGR
jgi:integrase